MILSSLRSGILTIKQNKKMIAIYYFFNLIFGLVVALPVYAGINRFTSHTLMSEKLGGSFDMDFFFEFLIKSPDIFNTLRFTIVIVAFLYWLWSLFLSGGAYFILISKNDYTGSLFWAGAANYFGRFFRLFLWSIPLFGILYSTQFIVTAIQLLLYGSDPYQNIIWWGAWIRVGIGYIGILIYYLVLDYARIDVVINNETKMRRALWYGIKFTFRNFFKTFSLSLMLFFIGIIVLVIYNPIADSLHTPNALIILILFIVQQIYMFTRMTLKLTLYSSQVKLYNTLTPNEGIAEPPLENA